MQTAAYLGIMFFTAVGFFSGLCIFMIQDVVLNYLCRKSGVMQGTSGVTAKLFDMKIAHNGQDDNNAAEHCGLSEVFCFQRSEQWRLLVSLKSRWCLLPSSGQ